MVMFGHGIGQRLCCVVVLDSLLAMCNSKCLLPYLKGRVCRKSQEGNSRKSH